MVESTRDQVVLEAHSCVGVVANVATMTCPIPHSLLNLFNVSLPSRQALPSDFLNINDILLEPSVDSISRIYRLGFLQLVLSIRFWRLLSSEDHRVSHHLLAYLLFQCHKVRIVGNF